MTRISFAIALAIFAVACHGGQSEQGDRARGGGSGPAVSAQLPSSQKPTKTGPSLKLMDGKVVYDGQELELGSTLDNWKKALGPDGKCDGDYREFNLHCWNDRGIWLEAEAGGQKKVTSLLIFLNAKPKPEDYGVPRISPATGRPVPPGIDFYHGHLFTGRLEIDGVPVSSASSVKQIDTSAGERYVYKCVAALRDCIMRTEEGLYDFGFSTDEGLDDGRIYRLVINRTEH